MNHDFWDRKLLQYFYAELSGSVREEFEQHLLGCEICQKELEELKALSEKISELTALELGQETLDRIVARAEIRDEKRLGGEFRVWWNRSRFGLSFAGAVSLVLALVWGIWFFQGRLRETDYDQVEFVQSLTAMEQAFSEEEGLTLVALVADSEESLEEIEDELSLILPEAESSPESFYEIEQDLLELEGLGEGIWEI